MAQINLCVECAHHKLDADRHMCIAPCLNPVTGEDVSERGGVLCSIRRRTVHPDDASVPMDCGPDGKLFVAASQ